MISSSSPLSQFIGGDPCKNIRKEQIFRQIGKSGFQSAPKALGFLLIMNAFVNKVIFYSIYPKMLFVMHAYQTLVSPPIIKMYDACKNIFPLMISADFPLEALGAISVYALPLRL